MDEKKYEHIVHPFPPLYDDRSRILILGSLPSVKSREQMFFYGHPQNRFWKVMSAVLGEALPTTIEEKKRMLLKHRIALWDTIYSCDIIGSSDSSIKGRLSRDPRCRGSFATAGLPGGIFRNTSKRRWGWKRQYCHPPALPTRRFRWKN